MFQCSISAKKNRLKSNEVHVGIKTTTSKWKIQFNFVDLCRLTTDNSDELLSNDYCGLTGIDNWILLFWKTLQANV